MGNDWSDVTTEKRTLDAKDIQDYIRSKLPDSNQQVVYVFVHSNKLKTQLKHMESQNVRVRLAKRDHVPGFYGDLVFTIDDHMFEDYFMQDVVVPAVVSMSKTRLFRIKTRLSKDT